ncbi:MAG: TIGR04086 family membrane protein [Clostridia bacterium]|nr:TIGR04086 family membrane protein [Clostridia bacterium]
MSRIKKLTKNPVGNIIFCLFSGIVLYFLLLSLTSYLILKIRISSEYLFLLNYIISTLSVMLTSLICAHNSHAKKLLKGFLCGTILCIFLFLIILFLNKSSLSIMLLLYIPICVISSITGCIAGINIRKQ